MTTPTPNYRNLEGKVDDSVRAAERRKPLGTYGQYDHDPHGMDTPSLAERLYGTGAMAGRTPTKVPLNTQEEPVVKEYQVSTANWSGKIYTDLAEAKRVFEYTKDSVMSEGVDDDSYVELAESTDEFETEIVLIRATAEQDEEQHALFGNPRDHGADYDWWAKWVEVKHPSYLSEK